MELLFYPNVPSLAHVPEKAAEIFLPEHRYFIMLAQIKGYPEKAKNTDWEGVIRRETTRMDYLPGLRPADLFKTATYMSIQPCSSIVLYHDGIDLCAETEHPYGHGHTVIRVLPGEKYDMLWEYIGKTGKKAWYKVMRHTLPVHEVLPELTDLAVPCRLVPN